MTDESPPRTISIPEAGRRYYGVSENTSYKLAEAGKIPFIQVGKRKKRVPVAAMEKILAAVQPAAA